MSLPQTITLTEYQPVHFPAEALPEAVGRTLWQHYGRQVEVQEPSFRTGGQWVLTAQGWAGHIPLTPEFHIMLQPKVALNNLFRMWEVAYRLNFEWLGGLIRCDSLTEFYENLALVLARRVLDRGRQGFYRAYVPQAELLPYVRGRLELRSTWQRPGAVNLPCHFEEHTADIADNQLLAWTLRQISHSSPLTERVLPTVRLAHRALHGLVTPVSFGPQDCLERPYHRLNEDYRPLHALCRFFLDQSGPSHTLGEQKMLPFLVDLACLYELFVAEWLKANLPPGREIKTQERVELSQTNAFHFEIDLVLYDTQSGQPVCVLDTKYKAADKPANEDIFQVVAYAEAIGCREAVLIYPTPLTQPLNEQIGDIRVRSLTFALAGDLAQAGQAFLQNLGHSSA